MDGSVPAMMLGMVGVGTTLICDRGWPQMNIPERCRTIFAVTSSRERRFVADPSAAGRFVIEFLGRTQHRRDRFHRIDLVKRPQNRKHKIGVVHAVGDGLRKGLSQRKENVAITGPAFLEVRRSCRDDSDLNQRRAICGRNLHCQNAASAYTEKKINNGSIGKRYRSPMSAWVMT